MQSYICYENDKNVENFETPTVTGTTTPIETTAFTEETNYMSDNYYTIEEKLRLDEITNSTRWKDALKRVGGLKFATEVKETRNFRVFVKNQLKTTSNNDILFTNMVNYVYAILPTQPTGTTQPTIKSAPKDENLIPGISNVYLHIGIGVVVSIIILVIILMMLNKSKPSTI